MRMPNFIDLYYNTATHCGDVNLKPEESESFDIGAEYSNRYFSLFVTSYLMSGDNMIDWVKNEKKWQSVNHASIDKKGIEIGVRFDLHENLDFLYPNTSLQIGYNKLHQSGNKVSKEQSSNYVLNYLRDKLTARLRLPLYKDKLTTSWAFRWQKRMGNYEDYSQGKEAIKTAFPAFSTMDFQMNYKLSSSWLINLNINNLYDTHYFDMGSIPQAGFWLTGGVSYTLR